MTPDELFAQLKDLKNEDDIKAVAKPFDQWIRSTYTTLESVRTQMIKFNKLIKSIPLLEGENAYYYQKQNGELVLKHFFYKYAGLKPEEYSELNSKSNAQKEERLDNGTPLDPTAYLAAVGKLLTSDDYRELAVGIIAATGRRPSEVMLRGSFTPAQSSVLSFPESQPLTHWLLFSGQLKKRRNTASEVYTIATLFPADYIIKSVKKLRKMPEVTEQIKAIRVELKSVISDLQAKYTNPDELEYQIALAENEAVDDKFETVTNRIVKANLPAVLEVRHGKSAITRSSLRAAYACLATRRDCPPSKNDLLWASRLLGHKEEKSDLRALLTTAGYFDYYLERDAIVPLLDEPKGEPTATFRGYQSDLEEIKAFQERWEISNQPETFRKIWELAKEALEARERKLFDKVELVENTLEEVKEISEMDKVSLLLEIEKMIDIKIASALASTQPQAQLPTPTAGTVTEVSGSLEKPETVQPTPKPIPEKNWRDATTDEIRGKKIPGSAEEKIKRACQAIFNFNDYTAKNNGERWYVGVRSIQDLSGCNYSPIKKFLEDYKVMVADHNTKHQLGNQHNKKHVIKISEVITNW